ncbi:hypothetical protein Scep_021920 [Stephania cephalantha]|uniref:Uncharacterized protein n=1 Tax=Stephania cephalantha TaxID=152367 RepID=A0AAP0I1S4_9MAGN
MLGGPSQAVQRTLITGTIKAVRSVRYMGRPSSGSGCVVRWQQGRGPGGQEARDHKDRGDNYVCRVTVGVGTSAARGRLDHCSSGSGILRTSDEEWTGGIADNMGTSGVVEAKLRGGPFWPSVSM